MADHYVDPALGTGADDGSSWANAWQSWATFFTAVGAGTVVDYEKVYVRNTETLGASLTPAQNRKILIIGVNAAGVEDGTFATIDADSTAANCISSTAIHYAYRNIEFINATANGVVAAATNTFRNCRFNSNGGVGLQFSSTGSAAYNCEMNNNTGDGVTGSAGCLIENSVLIGNGGDGLDSSTTDMTVVDCIIHNNTGRGITGSSNGLKVSGGVVDGNGSDGIFLGSSGCFVSGVRITNNGGYGIEGDAKAQTAFIDYCSFYNNTSGETTNVEKLSTCVTLTGDGYVDRASDDFSLTPAAEGRGLTYSFLDATNSMGLTIGLQNIEDYNVVGNVLDGTVYNTSLTGTLSSIPLTPATCDGLSTFTANSTGLRYKWSAGVGTVTGYQLHLKPSAVLTSAEVAAETYLVGTVNPDITEYTLVQDISADWVTNLSWWGSVKAMNQSTQDSSTTVIKGAVTGPGGNYQATVNSYNLLAPPFSLNL